MAWQVQPFYSFSCQRVPRLNDCVTTPYSLEVKLVKIYVYGVTESYFTKGKKGVTKLGGIDCVKNTKTKQNNLFFVTPFAET